MDKECIIWNGNNTDEVVEFCVKWKYELCRIYRVFTHLKTGVLTLQIEPSDTMRGYSLYIPINKKVRRTIVNGFYHSFEIEE